MPAMMDPVHPTCVIAGPVNSPTAVYPNTNNSCGHPAHPRYEYRDEQPRQFTAPVFHKADPHSDAHVSGDDYERSCVIYVAGLNESIDDAAFFDVFRQFGAMLSCVRRSVDFEMKPSGQQYAFIRYSEPSMAQYAVQMGEVEVQGRKLIIKPRDKKGSRYQRNSSYGTTTSNSYGEQAAEKILKFIKDPKAQYFTARQSSYDGNMDAPGGQQQSSTGTRSQAGGGPVLMSKILVVRCLPHDMCPKELFNLFGQLGHVEGVYVFPFTDPVGRRFGHVVMATFFLAQKAVESFNGFELRGSVLEVGYKSGPSVHSIPSPRISPMSVNTSQVQVPRLYMSPPMQASQSFGWHGSPNMYPNMPYGLHGPAMVPMGSYGGASPNQAVDYRHVHRSPSMSPTSSPLHGASWSQSPEQRAHVNGRTVLRAGEANKHGQPEGAVAAVASGPERLSRSVSNSTSNGSTLNTVSSYVNASPGGTSMTSDRPPTSTSMVLKTVDRLSPVAFELVNTPVIPEATKPTDPCNLFIKNLDDAMVSTSEDLKKLFEPYGTVASTHLATYNESKISKGFGFVAFTKPEDAAKAKERVNNTLVGKKRVFVSYAERKDDRAKRLKSIFRGNNNDEETVETVTKQTSESEKHDQAVATLENTQTKENVPISEKVAGSMPAGDQEDKSITESQEDHSSNLGMANSQDKHAVQDQSGRFLQKTTPGTNTAISTTLASGKGWRSTQLPGIAEVEEEDVLLHATETKAPTIQPKTKIPESKAVASSVSPVGPQVASVQPKPPGLGTDGATKKEGQQGERSNTRGRRNNHISKRAVSQQEGSTVAQGEIVSKARNVNSTNRSSSSRIPVQTKDGGTGNAPVGPRAAVQGPGQSSPANAPYQQKKQRGWNKMRGDRSGRSFDNKNVADGGGSSQKTKGNKHVEQREVENSVAGQVTITVAAH